MPLKPITNQGLQVAEPEYLPLKAYQSGGFYWDLEAQKVIRSVLGDFLPPLIQEWKGNQRTGLFQLIEDGKEILCQSRQAGSQNPVPARQINRLTRGLGWLAEKSQASETTPTNRFILREFRLPDFERDPELYRISGPFWNRRLHILWGCERLAESSLTPTLALAKLPARRFPKWLRWLAAILAALLLLWLLSQLFSGGCKPHHVNKAPGNDGVAASSIVDHGVSPLRRGEDSARRSEPNSSPDSTAPDSATIEPKTPSANASARGFQIKKLGGETTLADGRLRVPFVLKNLANPESNLTVDQWIVDGVEVGGDSKLVQDLTVRKHELTVRFHKPDGSTAEVSAWVTVAMQETATVEPVK